MPRFPSDSGYSNVNEIADEQGLIWDGHYGSPYSIEELIPKELQNSEAMDSFSHLFDHTKRFKPRGAGAKKPVLAITSPYQEDTAELRAEVQEFAETFGLEARVNDPSDRIYNVDDTIPILFWRADLHVLR